MSLQSQIGLLISKMKFDFSGLATRIAALEAAGGGSVAATLYDYKITRGGRVYSYEDARWISTVDDNYGMQTYNHTESAGTGVDPLPKWTRVGDILNAGEVIVGLDLFMRGNDAVNSSDFELMITFGRPDLTSQADQGWDNISEIVYTTLWRDMWMDPSDPDQLVTFTNINDLHLRKIELDFTVPVDGWINAYLKPTRGTTSTATDYFYFSMSTRIKAPPV